MKPVIIPEEKLAAYIKYCQQKNNSQDKAQCYCPACNSIVDEGPLFPYFYDEENNDVYFASLCPKCGEVLICKE